jgi:cytochrome c553
MNMTINKLKRMGIWALTLIFLLCALPANAERQKINWGKINPNQKNSASVGNTTECLFCHGEYVRAFMKTKHAKAFKAIYGHDVGASCENCHGPLGNHLAKFQSVPKTRFVFSAMSRASECIGAGASTK